MYTSNSQINVLQIVGLQAARKSGEKRRRGVKMHERKWEVPDCINDPTPNFL